MKSNSRDDGVDCHALTPSAVSKWWVVGIAPYLVGCCLGFAESENKSTGSSGNDLLPLTANSFQVIYSAVLSGDIHRARLVMSNECNQTLDLEELIFKANGYNQAACDYLMKVTFQMDWGFYRVDSIDEILTNKHVCFVRSTVTLNSPTEVGFRDMQHVPPVSNANGGGGIIFPTGKVVGKKACVTYQLLMEGGVWRLHCSSVSTNPIDSATLDKWAQILEWIVTCKR